MTEKFSAKSFHAMGDFGIQQPKPSAITIMDNRALVVSVNFDGTVEFGEGITPSEAAKAMWEEIAAFATTPFVRDAVIDSLKSAIHNYERTMVRIDEAAHADVAERLAASRRIAELEDAISGIADDYMTSQAHHPGHVLIPTTKFVQLATLARQKVEA
jgi:hypothetical protein